MSYLNTTNSDNDRARERGLEIAIRFPVTRDGNLWVVPNPPSRSFRYRVTLGDAPTDCCCHCEDFEATRKPCCHVHAAHYARMREGGQPLPIVNYPAIVPEGAPKWVTSELISETLRVWQVEYKNRLTVDDALAILIAVSRLGDLPGI
jgi:hypothetical protein